MKIKNVNGFSSPPCSCGSWLNHWKKFSGQEINYCPVDICLEKAEVGAHVQRDDDDAAWYIFPLCKKHADEKGMVLNVSDIYILISANTKKTCDT